MLPSCASSPFSYSSQTPTWPTVYLCYTWFYFKVKWCADNITLFCFFSRTPIWVAFDVSVTCWTEPSPTEVVYISAYTCLNKGRQIRAVCPLRPSRSNYEMSRTFLINLWHVNTLTFSHIGEMRRFWQHAPSLFKNTEPSQFSRSPEFTWDVLSKRSERYTEYGQKRLLAR